MVQSKPPIEVFSLLKYGATILVAIIVSMGGFWLSYGKDLVTRTEARTLEGELRTVLKANTDAIVDLKVQVASLTQTIKTLSETINQLKEN